MKDRQCIVYFYYLSTYVWHKSVTHSFSCPNMNSNFFPQNDKRRVPDYVAMNDQLWSHSFSRAYYQMRLVNTSLHTVFLLYLSIFIGVCNSIFHRGISSNGRALDLHSRGTGIDTRILQFLFCYPFRTTGPRGGAYYRLPCKHDYLKNDSPKW